MTPDSNENSLSRRLDRAYWDEDWARAERLARDLARRATHPAWYLGQLSSIYYETRRYARALRAAEKALELSPKDPLYLWYYAGALDMVGRDRGAIQQFRRIVRMGPVSAGTVHCREGKAWGESLVNDCRYRIGLCYSDLGEDTLVRKWIRAHLKHRRPGLVSLYSKREVMRTLEGMGRTSQD